MATPTPATHAGHLPTRQQLDEIDALLRRMLALPPLAGEAVTDSAPPPLVAAPPPAPAGYPSAIREVPPPRPPLPGDPVVKEWRVGWQQPQSVVAWGSPVPLATLADAQYHVDDQVARAYPQPTQYSPVAVPVPVASELTETQQTRQASLAAWPLIALNVTFNALTYLLGPPGAWLRGSGRSLMGWLGIGMILAAGVWATGEWFGYDWPRIDLSAVRAKLGLAK